MEKFIKALPCTCSTSSDLSVNALDWRAENSDLSHRVHYFRPIFFSSCFFWVLSNINYHIGFLSAVLSL